MHPEATAVVHDLIRLRAQLTPYHYDLGRRYARDYEPIVRPTFAEFPSDAAAYADCDELMLGPSLLVATVVEPGRATRRLRLPAGAAWTDFWTGERYAGGLVVELPSPWGRPPLLVREGAAIPMNVAEQHFAARADARAFALFAPAEGEVRGRCVEDDGESEAWRGGAFAEWTLTATASPARIDVRLAGGPPGPPPALLVRPAETRPLFVDGRPVPLSPFEGWLRGEIA
jgi:alpha-glucosidase